MSETNVIHEFMKNSGEKIRIELKELYEMKVFSCWIYYKAGKSKDEWKPCK